ncbi:MAG: hypothetical protein NPIRA02_00060 [Nitrospirales bacterium]|nr:MAG: hypothetical protein NPIRA02_00060 [Nitrospirales bacterium]
MGPWGYDTREEETPFPQYRVVERVYPPGETHVRVLVPLAVRDVVKSRDIPCKVLDDETLFPE